MPMMPKTHRAPTPHEIYERRGNRHEQGYTNRWARVAHHFLREHPVCVLCSAADRVTAATLVDHVIPHRGDDDLFWRESNWQALCAPCHNGPKRRADLLAARLAAGGAVPTPRGASKKVAAVAQPGARPGRKKTHAKIIRGGCVPRASRANPPASSTPEPLAHRRPRVAL